MAGKNVLLFKTDSTKFTIKIGCTGYFFVCIYTQWSLSLEINMLELNKTVTMSVESTQTVHCLLTGGHRPIYYLWDRKVWMSHYIQDTLERCSNSMMQHITCQHFERSKTNHLMLHTVHWLNSCIHTIHYSSPTFSWQLHNSTLYLHHSGISTENSHIIVI